MSLESDLFDRGADRSGKEGAVSVVDELTRLSRLHDSGSLTDEEFTLLKRRIIEDASGGRPD